MASEPNATPEALIEQATVDAYDDDEQVAGLFTTIYAYRHWAGR